MALNSNPFLARAGAGRCGPGERQPDAKDDTEIFLDNVSETRFSNSNPFSARAGAGRRGPGGRQADVRDGPPGGKFHRREFALQDAAARAGPLDRAGNARAYDYLDSGPELLRGGRIHQNLRGGEIQQNLRTRRVKQRKFPSRIAVC